MDSHSHTGQAVASGGSALGVSGASSEYPSWVFPLLLSCLAGASTCVGAAVVFCFEPSKIRKSMAFSLSLAAAVMITVSVVSILPEVADGLLVPATHKQESYDLVVPALHASAAILKTRLLLERLVSFAIGAFAYLLLASLLVLLPDPEHMYLLDDPGEEEDHKRNYDLYLSEDDRETNSSGSEGDALGSFDTTASDVVELGLDSTKQLRRRVRNHKHNGNIHIATDQSDKIIDTGGEDLTAFTTERRKRSWRVALMLFASLLIHNFPEGLCVAASAKESPELGITVAIGIFIHNVPEGIAISVPCIAARPDRPWLAFWLASFSGLAEPLGAAVALSMLDRTKLDLENVLAFVAGVMITVAFWELYPEAIKANIEELAHRNPSRGTEPAQGLQWHEHAVAIFLRDEHRPILWGTLFGTVLMVTTELLLP